ncbi:MAG: nucleoside triphosphate pyrophosphohydrolase family protein [Candidatus Nanoarchaeia archaeon]|nr:nucleoside triphosphate pyrophosphohydrolase family protein [Candidatus Nanoarchaeia archaeon]
MNLKEYQELCKATAKKFQSKEEELCSWGLGIAGEAGDVASCVKKVIFHKNEAIKDGIKENLGDTIWYAAMICNNLGWDLEEILKENIQKLKDRYPGGFTEKDAQRGGTMIKWSGVDKGELK